MKKRLFIAVLLAALLTATCLTGYTCNGNDGVGKEEQGTVGGESSGSADGIYVFEKGEEVTAEEWASAFEATVNLKNYTAYALSNNTVTATGNYNGDINLPVNVTQEVKGNATLFCEIDNGKAQFIIKNTNNVSGFSDVYSLTGFDADNVESLKMFLSISAGFYETEDNEEIQNQETDVVQIGGAVYQAYKTDGAISWAVASYDTMYLTTIYTFPCATEKDGEVKPVCEWFDKFVYSDGVYSADVYIDGDAYVYSVSFKDGYILSAKAKTTQVKKENNLTVTYVKEMGETVSKIGNTVVTLSPDAVQAVEDYVKTNT